MFACLTTKKLHFFSFILTHALKGLKYYRAHNSQAINTCLVNESDIVKLKTTLGERGGKRSLLSPRSLTCSANQTQVVWGTMSVPCLEHSAW